MFILILTFILILILLIYYDEKINYLHGNYCRSVGLLVFSAQQY